MKTERSDLKPALTIGPDGLLRIFGRCLDYNHPFVLLGGMVCFLTSDTNMGIVHDPRE